MINLTFSKPWQHSEDTGGNVVRQFPRGWRGELPDDVAFDALADGVAEAELNKKQIAAVEDIIADRQKAVEDAASRRAVAEAIRADAARVITASDDELVAMAESAETAGSEDAAATSDADDA